MHVEPARKLIPPNVAGESWLGETALPKSWIGFMVGRDRVDLAARPCGISVAQ